MTHLGLNSCKIEETKLLPLLLTSVAVPSVKPLVSKEVSVVEEATSAFVKFDASQLVTPRTLSKRALFIVLVRFLIQMSEGRKLIVPW